MTSVAEVLAAASRITTTHRALVLLAAFTTLRFGELAALRRRDVNLETLTVYVKRTQAELSHAEHHARTAPGASHAGPAERNTAVHPLGPRPQVTDSERVTCLGAFADVTRSGAQEIPDARVRRP